MTIPDQAIEAAARAMHSHQMVGLSELAWLTLDPIGRDYWTGKARAALTAAAPFMAAQAKGEAWDEGFSAGWAEAKDPGAFVNDVWDAETPNPYNAATIEGKSE